MKMFRYLDIETSSNCNRRCSTCIRNSHPDVEKIKPWFENSFLPEPIIYSIVSEAVHMGFNGQVCLSHYNEPLMDKRITKIVRNLKVFCPGVFTYFHTNGDLLTEELAEKLDGVLDRIVVTLYLNEPEKSERAQWLHTLFGKTIMDVITESAHIPTHFSPAFDVKALAEAYKLHTCFEPSMRIIVNHRGEYLMCCDDVIGNFDLGSYPDKTLEEHWEEKLEFQSVLSTSGGRSWHPYCESCPRP